MATFSERISFLRLKSNLSLRQLSKLTGISSSALHSYEVGKREASYKSLEALSDVFNCDIDYLLGKTDIKNSVANAYAVECLYDLCYTANNKEKILPTAESETLTEGERMLLELFRKVPESDQQMVLGMIRVALSKQE